MKEAFTRLISGSDIRGVAVADAGQMATLTPSIGSAVGAVFACWLANRLCRPVQDLSISVGMDSRVSGPELKAAMLQGIASAGAKAIDCGLCTTPAMFMSTRLLPCDGAVMVTASHLPWQRNGYKFFTPKGGLDGADIEMLLGRAADVPPVQTAVEEAATRDLLSQYTHTLRAMVKDALGGDRPLEGLHVVVDAGNGAGGFYAELLQSLGANTEGSQFLVPDGYFPNHAPNPEAPEAMASLSKAVLAAGADIGVLFDADCDRAAMVDRQGKEINRNRLIALVSAVLLSRAQGITVVTDSVVSAGLDAFLRAKGGHLHRFKRGYRNVIDEAIRLNGEGVDCPLAIETSGHAALRDNFFLDDGMYLITLLIIEASRLQKEGRQLESLIEDLREPVEATEVRLPILCDDFRIAGAEALEAIRAAVGGRPEIRIDTENREGLRLQFASPDRWVMLRLSVHDPLLVINAESDEAGGVKRMLGAVADLLSSIHAIDSTALIAHSK